MFKNIFTNLKESIDKYCSLNEAYTKNVYFLIYFGVPLSQRITGVHMTLQMNCGFWMWNQKSLMLSYFWLFSFCLLPVFSIFSSFNY